MSMLFFRKFKYKTVDSLNQVVNLSDPDYGNWKVRGAWLLYQNGFGWRKAKYVGDKGYDTNPKHHPIYYKYVAIFLESGLEAMYNSANTTGTILSAQK